MTQHAKIRVFACLILTALIPSIAFGAVVKTLPEYRQAVINTSKKLQTALYMEKAKPDTGSSILRDLESEWHSPVVVAQADGQSITSDQRWISQDLRRVSKLPVKLRFRNLQQLSERVFVLTKAVALSKDPRVSPDRAHAVLAKVLARSEYKPSAFDIWLAKTLGAIGDAFAGLFGGVSPAVGTFIVWAVAALFAAALVFLVIRLLGTYKSPVTSIRQPRPEKIQIKRPSIDSLLEDAETEASQGRYKDAFRRVYLASLLLLDRKGIITYTDSGTNWEYMRSVANKTADEKTRVFRTLTSLFDVTVYGHKDLVQHDYFESKNAFHELEKLS